MAKPIADGDSVKVSDRESTPADIKSQLFYEHYRGLTGTVAKVYADGTASVNIDPETLPSQLSGRHGEGAEAVRRKFLGELSEEGRNKLSAAEKKFAIRYTILVATSDLMPIPKPKAAPQAAEKPAAPASAPAVPDSLFDVAGQQQAAPARPTLADLERAEQEHLEELRRKSS
jgi:hypothetical protein